MLMNILSISGSIGYDALKHELWLRCASQSANWATLKTVSDVMNKKNKNYKKNIMNKDNEIKTNKEIVTIFVRENNEKYSNELTLPYYPGAFPNGCPK